MVVKLSTILIIVGLFLVLFSSKISQEDHRIALLTGGTICVVGAVMETYDWIKSRKKGKK